MVKLRESARGRNTRPRLPTNCRRVLSVEVVSAAGRTHNRTPMNSQTTMRVSRPTDRLPDVVRFYVVGLGFDELGSFEDHDGFDGAMIGAAGAPYHLEFTHKRGHTVGLAATKENILRFYLPDVEQWQVAGERMEAAGYAAVKSINPYWDRCGRTFEDPDGYRVVLQNAAWSR